MRVALACMTYLLSSVALAAIPIDGWYTNAFGGYTYIPSNINNTHLGVKRNQATYQSGFDAGGSFGYKSNPMRYEGEITYLKANINKFDVNYRRQTGVNGYNQALFGMANVFYDFPGILTSIQPFLGAGIGYSYVQAKLDSTGPLAVTRFTGGNSAFAYQATGGLTYNFAENYALNVGYRYLATTNISELGQMFQAHLANVGAVYRFDGNNYK